MHQVCSVYCVLTAFATVFSREFARAVKHHQSGRNAKGFSSWEQFVAMLFWAWPVMNPRIPVRPVATGRKNWLHLGTR